MKLCFPNILLLVLFSLFIDSPMPAFSEKMPDIEAVMEAFDAEEETGGDILDGFEDDGQTLDLSAVPDEEVRPPIFQINGHAKIGASYNLAHQTPRTGMPDWRGLSRLRPEFQLELKTELGKNWQGFASAKSAWDTVYGLRDRDDYTGQVLNRNESETEVRETYVSGRLSKNLDLKVGRQIVVWGKSDNIRVTDVLNPLDMREPGLTDIEDLRLPAAMTRLDYYFGPWNLTGIAVHEIRFNKMPAWGSDFYPAAVPLPPESVPADSLENTEFALALNGVFSGWDIAVYYADVCDDMTHLRRVPGTFTTERRHARLEMLGAAGNLALGNWLLKAEAAWLQGFEFFNAPGQFFDRTDVLVGLEYSGVTDTTITLEAVCRRMLDFDDRLKAAPDMAAEEKCRTALRLSRDFLNETLNLTLLALTYGPTGQDGALQRMTVEFDISDATAVTGGVVLYQSGDLPEMRNIGDNDRLYLEVKVSF
jgi:Protein of unknown function (DUF1302)